MNDGPTPGSSADDVPDADQESVARAILLRQLTMGPRTESQLLVLRIGEATTEEAGTAETGGETVKATRPAPALPKPARVTVVVFPWGNVWINGKPQGAAPLKDHTLKPGRYQIGGADLIDPPLQIVCPIKSPG